MADQQNTQGTGASHQVVGKVFVLYGTVKAIAPDGTVRVLSPNSPVFAYDRIVTESDGRVSIIMEGTQMHLDLGRMSDVVLDEDVFGGATPETVSDAAAEVEQIQMAILEGEEPIELEATAAGGPASAGGGHPTVVFELTGEVVTPTSGAETEGITTSFPDPIEGVAIPDVEASEKITLDDVQVLEDNSIVYTAHVNTPPQGTDLVITLSNGVIIVIPVGQTTGSTVTAPQGDDPYKDPENFDVSIGGTTGGGYTSVDMTDTAHVDIQDTIDPTVASITGPASVVEGQTTSEYTVTLSNVPQTPVVISLNYSGSAQDGTDFSGVINIEFAPGETEKTFTIDTIKDLGIEDVESFTVSIGEIVDGDFESIGPDDANYSVETAIVEPFDTAGEVQESDMDEIGSTPEEPDESIINGQLNLQTGWTAMPQTGQTAHGTYQINPDGTYVYSYTLVSPADHSAGAVTDVIQYNAQDADGNIIVNTITINILDDAPSIAVTGEQRVSAVDETNLSANSAVHFSQVFTPVLGADGGTVTYSLGINAENADSGLLDAITGEAVVLTINDGVVEGRSAESGDLIFTVGVDAGTGEVKLDQVRALIHEDPSDPNDTATIAGGVLTLTATATDEDGDTASAGIDLGAVISFLDDGPTLTVTADGAAAEALAVELDESVGADRYNAGEAPDNGNVDDAGPGLAQVTTAVSGGLTSLFAVGGDYGADQAGTTTGELSFVGFPEQGGLATNLTATAGGAITLYLENGMIVGRDAAMDQVLTIEIVNDGNGDPQLQTTLYEAIDQGADAVDLFDENLAMLLTGEGAVQLQYEVTRQDADGDEIIREDQLDLITGESSVFSFDDDGPTVDVGLADASMDSLVTQDADTIGSAYDTDSGVFAKLFTLTSDMGADDDGTVPALSYSLSVTTSATGLTSDGQAITVALVGDDIVGSTVNGDIFSISVNAGTGEVTLTQYAEIDHLPEDVDGVNDNANLGLSAGNILLTASATIVDGDADSAGDSETIDISGAFSFDDDIPTVDVGLADASML